MKGRATMRGSDGSPQTSGRSSKLAALGAGDAESQNRQHNVCDEERRIWLLFTSSGKDAFMLVFWLGNFGRGTFQLDIELVDNRSAPPHNNERS
jgi:hypothetical protein